MGARQYWTTLHLANRGTNILKALFRQLLPQAQALLLHAVLHTETAALAVEKCCWSCARLMNMLGPTHT